MSMLSGPYTAAFGADGPRPGMAPPDPNKAGGQPARPSRRSGPDYSSIIRRIEEEIKRGLPNEKRLRLDGARINQDFYDLNFTPYVAAWDIDRDAIRTSGIMRRVVDVLTANLYKDGPSRKIQDQPEATKFLEEIYRKNAVDAILQEADRLSTVHQVAAIEVRGRVGPGSDSKPIGIDLWGGDSFCAWMDPEDQRSPIAVATIDMMDEQRRIRLWTAEERVTFVTAKQGLLQTSGGTAFTEQKREANPYNCLPFSFIHHRYPATYFWSGGPGDDLRALNSHVNYRLSRMADDILHGRPIGVIEGAHPSFNFPRDRKSGTFTTIPPAVIDAGGASSQNPEVKYITMDMGFIESDWKDLSQFLDHVLEMNGVPAGAIRLEHSNIQSGVAIVAEQLPLLVWSEARQRPFGYYEQELARVVLTVSAAHARNNGQDGLLDAPVEALEEAANDPDLSLQWKSQLGPLLASQQTPFDTFRLQYQLVSKTQYYMERYNLSREDAEAKVVELAHDLEREAELFQSVTSTGGLGAMTGATPGEGENPEDQPTDAGQQGADADAGDGADQQAAPDQAPADGADAGADPGAGV